MSTSTPEDGKGAVTGEPVEVAGTGVPEATTRPGRVWWRQHWLRHLLGLAVVLGVLIGVIRPLQVTPSPIPAANLVVIGVGERTELLPVDREILDARASTAAYGVVVSSRQSGECVSTAWLTLGAGAEARTADQCSPQLVLTPAARLAGRGGAAITNWSQLAALNTSPVTALNASPRTDLGALAASVPTGADDPRACLEAVGPGAALAAAAPDGSVARYVEPSTWAAGDYATQCRVTIVDPVLGADDIIRRLAGRPDTTLLVLGLGPAGPQAGSRSGPVRAAAAGIRSVEAAYRVDPDGSGAVPGALSSGTTLESGVITLPDVSAAIIGQLHGSGSAPAPAPARTTARATGIEAGAALGVVPGQVSAAVASSLLHEVATLQRRGPIMAGAAALFGLVLASVVLMIFRRRWRPAGVLAGALTTWPVALLAGGMVPWYRTTQPILAGLATVLGAWIVAVVVARLLTTPRRPTGIAGAALSLAVTAASAAVGDIWRWGTLLDSTTALGPDWFGIGPGAAGVCVASALAIAAWWAERLPKRQSVLAIIGLVVIVGVALWPSVTYVVALAAGGAVLTFADTARDWVRQAIPWADPLFVGTATAALVAALVGTVVPSLASGTILLAATADSPLFGGVVMGWLASVTLALWLQLRAPEWFAARDEGRLPDPLSL
ncbi:hypothetical protein [Raineyella fluvialis]|uniref:Uncharacterized protein n=1 Tax=Raineyella fluvialis TaxID=2662261 RepID=A0A5Q2FAV7_9ACTN|nr:hypothetical protein [Raineyella fluvialis]QGF23838.1 hypothetical protein Rai3103_09300 [Raineyella fluvialis]